MLDGELTFVLKDIFKEARYYPAKQKPEVFTDLIQAEQTIQAVQFAHVLPLTTLTECVFWKTFHHTKSTGPTSIQFL